MLLRVGLAGGRSNDDGRRQAAFAGAGTVGGLLWFLGACWLGQLAAARAKLAKLKDFLETEDALRFLLCINWDWLELDEVIESPINGYL